jgi:hypothetical protein
MTGLRLKAWIAGLLLLTVVATGFIFLPRTAEPPDDHLRAEWPECPHDWSRVEVSFQDKQRPASGAMSFTFPTGLSVSKDKTNIPEFHDCQRIVLPDRRTYGPLMAVFAAADLGERRFVERERSDPTGEYAAAEIFNDSATFTYDPLGIGPKFNCLYIMRLTDGTLWAKMVHVGDVEQDCAKAVNPVIAPGKMLEVRETLVGEYAHSAIPAVARWDWDERNAEQYIGLKCGNAWCEVGRPAEGRKPAFESSKPYIPPPTGDPAKPERISGEDRVRAIKGWYDQQHLAIDAGMTLRPGPVMATFFPDSLLRTRVKTDFEGQWVVTSYVAFSGPPGLYKNKFNFDQAPGGAKLNRMNRLSLCFGTSGACAIPLSIPIRPSLAQSCGMMHLFLSQWTPGWWVRIESLVSGRPQYRCVKMRPHPVGFSIPATTRWRWLADDETGWEWCPNGCCEIQSTFQ